VLITKQGEVDATHFLDTDARRVVEVDHTNAVRRHTPFGDYQKRRL
jgi:hypothetical protein